MAVFAPMPSASVRTATAVKAGLLARVRTAERRSWSRASIRSFIGPGAWGSGPAKNAPGPSLQARFSFVPQGHHRIDVRRPTGGEIARQRGDAQEHQRRSSEHQRVVGRDAIEQGGDRLASNQRHHRPYRHADERDTESLTDDETEQVAAGRAERESDTKLLRAA